MYAECSRKREDKQYFIDCNLIESLVHLHTTHRKCKKWVLDSYDTGVQTTRENNKNVLNIHLCTYLVTIVKRGQFGNPKDYFQKTFEEYEKGFGEEEKGDLM